MYQDEQIPEPPTFNDDYNHRAEAARSARMRIENDPNYAETVRELKTELHHFQARVGDEPVEADR